jgi:DNA-binding NarL/FixJ family response regulator
MVGSNTPNDAATQAAQLSSDSEWPFVERRKADRRASRRRQEHETADERCTDREQQILALVLQGLTNKEIARQLGIVEDTVKKHLFHVYAKLGVRRRALIILGNGGRARRRSA